MEAQEILSELMDDVEPKHKFHSLIRTKIDMNFVSAVYEISSVIVPILDFFEQDDRRTISEVIPCYEFLIRFCCSESAETDSHDYVMALKKSLLCSISEQLFQKYADEDGKTIENRMVPKRVNHAEKLAYFLSWNSSTCKLSRAVSELRATRIPQFVATAQIIEAETVDSRAEITNEGFLTWKNQTLRFIEKLGKQLGFTDEEQILNEGLEPVQIGNDEDDFVDPELLEDSTAAPMRSQKSELSEELSSYTCLRTFNMKDWNSCKW